MKITTFNPLIITKDPESAISLFEGIKDDLRCSISEYRRFIIIISDIKTEEYKLTTDAE